MSKKIIQPNQVTKAKYDFSSVQKNVIYKIIGRFQSMMSKGSVLMEEQKLTFKLKEIDPNRNALRVIKEIEKLYHKPIRYSLNTDKGEANVLSTVVSSVVHYPKTDEVTFIVPSYAMPFFCHWGAIGYTSYQQTVAISLKSKYSKRLYEYCCKWKDKGGFPLELKELREILNVENKFKQLGQLKQYVLEIAKKELKEHADVWFDYSLHKVGGSRSFNEIRFKIHQNKPKSVKKGEKGEHYSFVHRFLNHTYPTYSDGMAVLITDKLLETDQIKTAYHRFKKLDDELIEGKKKKEDIIRLTKHILRKDYQIEY